MVRTWTRLSDSWPVTPDQGNLVRPQVPEPDGHTFPRQRSVGWLDWRRWRGQTSESCGTTRTPFTTCTKTSHP